jgi:hypothetical protein
MTANVIGDFAGGGLGRMLIQGVAKDLTRRGVKAVEAFGDLKWQGLSCVVPADYLLAVGFKTVRPHAHYPRLRLELKTALSWREDVEVALERLLGSMSPERSLRLALPTRRPAGLPAPRGGAPGGVTRAQTSVYLNPETHPGHR